MNLLFFKSNWEAAHLPVETFLERVRLPFTAQPVADAWDVNVEFFSYLRRALAVT